MGLVLPDLQIIQLESSTVHYSHYGMDKILLLTALVSTFTYSVSYVIRNYSIDVLSSTR